MQPYAHAAHMSPYPCIYTICVHVHAHAQKPLMTHHHVPAHAHNLVPRQPPPSGFLHVHTHLLTFVFSFFYFERNLWDVTLFSLDFIDKNDGNGKAMASSPPRCPLYRYEHLLAPLILVMPHLLHGISYY
jgi:hypothetical protein